MYAWQWYVALVDYVDAELRDVRAFRVSVLMNPVISPVHPFSLRDLPVELLSHINRFLTVPLLRAIHGSVDPIELDVDEQIAKNDCLEFDYYYEYEFQEHEFQEDGFALPPFSINNI